MDMSFRDIFTSSFLSHVNAVTGWDMGITLFLSLCMGLFILFIYTLVYEKALYSVSFGVTLVGLSMITATLILAVSSNVTLSLGMVGALSIVRFRTAIKDPLEIVFLFWSIETGIVIASGLIPLAVFVNFMIGLVLWLLAKGKTGEPYILILKCDQKNIENVEEFIAKNVEGTPVLKGVTPDLRQNFVGDAPQVILEKVFEVTLKRKKNLKMADASFISDLYDKYGVEKALLVTYNGAYTG